MVNLVYKRYSTDIDGRAVQVPLDDGPILTSQSDGREQNMLVLEDAVDKDLHSVVLLLPSLMSVWWEMDAELFLLFQTFDSFEIKFNVRWEGDRALLNTYKSLYSEELLQDLDLVW